MLTLYRYMDISCCDLCTSICDTLEARNRHWLGKGFFDPLLHDTRCRSGGSSRHCSSSRIDSNIHPVQAITGVSGCTRTAQASKEHGTTGSRQQDNIRQLGLQKERMEQLHNQYASSTLYTSHCLCPSMEQDMEPDVQQDTDQGMEQDMHQEEDLIGQLSKVDGTCSRLEGESACHGSEPSPRSQPTCACVHDDCTCSACDNRQQELASVPQFHGHQSRASAQPSQCGRQAGAEAYRSNTRHKHHSKDVCLDKGQQYSGASAFSPAGPGCHKKLPAYPQDEGLLLSEMQPPLTAEVQPDVHPQFEQESCMQVQGTCQPRVHNVSSQNLNAPGASDFRRSTRNTLENQCDPGHVQSSSYLGMTPVFEGPTSVRVDR